jgi:hypothetical protein
MSAEARTLPDPPGKDAGRLLSLARWPGDTPHADDSRPTAVAKGVTGARRQPSAD